MIFFDTETVGKYGPIVIIQWVKDDDPEINIHNVWLSPISETFAVIDELVFEPQGICGFNIAFDWFHVCQLYTTLQLLRERYGDVLPIDYVEEYAELEPLARDGLCLKPISACDIMLHARKGPYQSTMEREDIRIKRVPACLAHLLADELDKRIPLNNIYFARKKDPKRRWQVYDITNDLGDVIPDFKDVVLKFAPSSALKALAKDALNLKEDSVLLYADIELPKELYPEELGYAPYAMAIATRDERGRISWNKSWPQYLENHVYHWEYNELARKYSANDVLYTRDLWHFFGCPEPGDDDSILAVMVGAVRWRGFKINIDALKAQLQRCRLITSQCPFNYRSVDVVKRYLRQVMSDLEALSIAKSTKGKILEEISRWTVADVCPECNGGGCLKCENTGFVPSEVKHPAAIRAREILDLRAADKEIELYEKLIKAGRFHASFNVIGTKSTRMSGADGLNPQGINHEHDVRACFELAFEGMILCGGDFDQFEVGIADAAYNDPKLHELLLQGKKIHGIFGQFLFPGKSYEEICATKEEKGDKNLYSRSKQGVFAVLYGGEGHTLVDRVGITKEAAESAFQHWLGEFKGWAKERERIRDEFTALRQPRGIGTKIEWSDPADFVESMLGFRRYFTLENKIMKALFDLAQDLPDAFKKVEGMVVRRDRVQTPGGACCSALYASAFAIQGANFRAAANHKIQASGAQITKRLQCELWTLQPVGINHWRIVPLNIHDEVDAAMIPSIAKEAEELVGKVVESYKPIIPLIAMEWKTGLESWASK